MVQMAEGVGRDGQEGGQDVVAGKEYDLETWKRVAAKLAFVLIGRTSPSWDKETRIHGAGLLLAVALEEADAR